MVGRGRSWIGVVCLAAAAAIWGGMYVVSAAVLRVIPAWILLELRFLLACTALAAVAARMGQLPIAKRDLLQMALLGVVGYTGSIGMQFLGTAQSGAAMGALITSASPALISGFAYWWLRESITGMDLLGLCMGLGGVAIVVLPTLGANTLQSSTFSGALWLVGAALLWGAYTVLSRRATMRYASLTVTFWSSLFGALFTLPLALIEWEHTGWILPSSGAVWAGVLYLGIVSTTLAFFLWNKGFEYLPQSGGSLFFLLQPVVGTLLGWALLGESLTPSFLIGGLLIVASVFVGILPQRNQQRQKARGSDPT
ncbi:MAG: DMT family transporter [Firmicutes bacterium]|nr:DMT family transporter [Bacillota bacterium]